MTASRSRSRLVWTPVPWSPLARYCGAVVLVGLTGVFIGLVNGTDWGILARITIENPGTVFIAAVTLAAVVLGAGPGLVAILASAIAIRVGFWSYESGSRLAVLIPTMLIIVALAERQQRAQRRAERTQATFEAIIAGMSDAVMVVDGAGNPTDVNQAAVAMLGARDRADAMAHLTRSRTDGTPMTDEYALLRRALAGEDSPRADVAIPDRPGGERTVSAVANALRDTSGRLIGAVSVSRDLTERLAQAREREVLLLRVEREREFTQHVLTNLPVGIAVLRADDFTVLSFNEEYAASIRAARGGGTLAVGESFFAAIPAASRDAARTLLTQARDGDTIIRNSGYSSPVAPDRFYDGTIQRLALSDGTEALLITAVNVTERVMAERERERLLREIEGERRFTRLILDAVPVSIAAFRPEDLTLVNANANFAAYVESLAGHPLAVGDRLLERLPGLAGSRFVADIREAMAEHRAVGVTGYAAVAPEGHYYDWTMQPLLLNDGETGALVTFADVTGRVEAERERERLLAEVERQAALLSATLEAMVDGISAYDTEGNVLRRNAAFFRILHIEPDAPPPLWDGFIRDLDLRLPDGTPMTKEQTHSWRALHGETVRGEIMRLRNGLGQERFVSQNASPIRGADGAVLGAVVVFNDVTERLEQERERAELLRLVEERRRFTQAIFDTVPVCLAVIDAGTMRFRAANPAFLDGLPAPYRTIGVYDQPLIGVLPHTEANGFRDQIQQIGETGETQTLTATRYEHPTRGTTYWNEVLALLPTTGLETPHVLYISADVTEVVLAERRANALALIAAERANQLEAVIASLAEGLLLADADGNIVQSNAALRDLLGLDADTPLPTLHDFGERFAMRSADGLPIPREERAGIMALRGASRTDQLRRFRTARGDERWMSVNSSPIRTSDGAIAGVAMTLRDVTEGLEQQRQIAAHARQLDAVFTSLTDGLILSDTEGNIIQSNEALHQMLGLPEGAALPPFPVWGEWFALRTAETTAVPSDTRAWDRARRGETVIDARRRFRTMQGEERWMSVNASPVRDDSGEIIGMAMTLRDVTAQMEAQERIAALAREASERAAQLETIIANIPDGVIIASPDGGVRQLNATALTILGMGIEVDAPPERQAAVYAVRYPDGTPIPPDEIPVARAARGESYSDVEVMVRAERGDRFLFCRGAPIRDPEGTITGAIVVFSDITERKRAEQERERLLAEIEERRQFAQTVIEHAPVGIAVFATDPEFTVRIANEEYARLLDEPWRSRGVVGVGVREYLPRAVENDIPAIFARVAETGEGFSTREFEYAGFTRGTVYFDWSLVPLYESGDRVTGLLAIAQDVTDRVLSQQRIEELADTAAQRAAELEAVFTSLPVGVAIHAKDGRVVQMNAAGEQITGTLIPPDDALPAIVDEFAVRDAAGNPIALEDLPIRRALRGETVSGFEMMSNARGGTHLLISAAPIRGAMTSEISGAVVSFSDITPLKQLEQMKDEFISIAAHELRTPLTAIKGYTDLLDRRMSNQDGRDRDRQSLAIIRRQTDRLTGLVNEMLDVSRIEAGRLLLNYEPFDLSALAREVAMHLRPSSESHRITVAAEPGIEISADATRVEQVLINLIGNAITYSPEGGPVDVRVWRDGENAKIAVRDEGVGIAADELPHLFERFYRAPRAGIMRSGGMGLGLYISNEIVHRHGGTITVESDEGKGSIFTVTLPLTGSDGQ